MKKKIWLIPLALLLAVSLVACAAPAPATAPQKTLHIGGILVLSGPGAAWGVPMTRGPRIVIDRVNAEGGVEIGGERYLLEFHPEDSEYSTEGAATAARKLVDRYKVKFILGATVSHTTLPMLAITTPAKVLSFGTYWSNDGLKKELGAIYGFKDILSPHEAYPSQVDYILSTYPDFRKWAILSVNSMSGIYGAELYEGYLPTRGVEVVANEYHEYGVIDFYPYLARILAQEPDVICTGADSPPAWGLILKQAREMGFEGKFVMTETVTDEMLAIAGPAADGLIISEPLTYGPEATPEVKAFRAEYLLRHNIFDPFSIYHTYALLIMLEAYKELGTIDDPDAVVQLLETTTFYPFGQEARFGDGGGHYEIPHGFGVVHYLLEIKGGERSVVGVISVEDQLDVKW